MLIIYILKPDGFLIRPTNVVKAAHGGAKGFFIAVDDSEEQIIPITAEKDQPLKVMSFLMHGNLETTESVRFRYVQQDIMCLEMLQLDALNTTLNYNLIQDFDLKAWAVSEGDQKWKSLTGRKISYFAKSCLADERAVTQSAPFRQSCHRTCFLNPI